jgi:hypothetical protein
MRVFAAAVAAAAVLMTAQSVAAQTATASSAFGSVSAQAASVRRSVRRTHAGFRAYGIFETEALTASQSFDAVLGTSRFKLAGGGGELVHFWKGAFVRVMATKGKKTGERVFVTSAQKVIPLGIPVTVQMTPSEVGGGWRFGALDRRGRFEPYAGVSGLFLRYKETSQFAESGEDTDKVFLGTSLFGGIDVGLSFVHLGVEGVYRRVPKAIGDAGVSKSFGENDLGGAVMRILFGIGF